MILKLNIKVVVRIGIYPDLSRNDKIFADSIKRLIMIRPQKYVDPEKKSNVLPDPPVMPYLVK